MATGVNGEIGRIVRKAAALVRSPGAGNVIVRLLCLVEGTVAGMEQKQVYAKSMNALVRHLYHGVVNMVIRSSESSQQSFTVEKKSN